MFTLLSFVLFIWLLVKAIGLAVKLTWGAAKIAASILIAIAMPILIGGLLFAGGVLLLVPVILAAIAVGILKAVV